MSKLHAYILIDRSGSMIDRWKETICAVNEYAETLLKETPSVIHVAVFDAPRGGGDFNLIRNEKEWTPIDVDEVKPRGMTPLYDAVGQMLNLADENADKKQVLVVVTDGAENASREETRETIQKRLDLFKEGGKQVVFLGADFNNFCQARGLGVKQSVTMVAGTYAANLRGLAMQSSTYAATGQAIDVNKNDL